MKIETDQKPKPFHPITLTITIETLEELEELSNGLAYTFINSDIDYDACDDLAEYVEGLLRKEDSYNV